MCSAACLTNGRRAPRHDTLRASPVLGLTGMLARLHDQVVRRDNGGPTRAMPRTIGLGLLSGESVVTIDLGGVSVITTLLRVGSTSASLPTWGTVKVVSTPVVPLGPQVARQAGPSSRKGDGHGTGLLYDHEAAPVRGLCCRRPGFARTWMRTRTVPLEAIVLARALPTTDSSARLLVTTMGQRGTLAVLQALVDRNDCRHPADLQGHRSEVTLSRRSNGGRGES